MSLRIALSNLSFQNTFGTRSQHSVELKWTNTGTEPVIAFEVVVLKYDPFNRREVGSALRALAALRG